MKNRTIITLMSGSLLTMTTLTGCGGSAPAEDIHAAEDAVVALRAGRIKRERRLVSIVRPERVSLRADQARRPGTVPPPRRDERRER